MMKTLKIQFLFLFVLFACLGHSSFDVVAKSKERILVAHSSDEKREKGKQPKKDEEHEKKPHHEDERKEKEKHKPHREKKSKEKIKRFEREGRNLKKRERKLEEELKELNEKIAKDKSRLKENDNFLNRFRLENLLRKARRLTEELDKLRKQKQAMENDLTFNRSHRISDINLRLAQIARSEWNAAKDNRVESAKIAREISLLVNERTNLRYPLLKAHEYKPKGAGWRLKPGHGPKELKTRVSLARHRLKEVQKQLSSTDQLRIELESQKQLNAKLLKLPNFANSFYPTVRNAAKALRDEIKTLNSQIGLLNVKRQSLSANASLFREIIVQFEASQKHTENGKD